MQEWGWTNPVLVDESGMIIAGHGRVMAAQSLGYDEAPVMVAVGWSEAQKKAYVIADNKIGELGGWDEAILTDEIFSLDGIDLSSLGFSAEELTALGEEIDTIDIGEPLQSTEEEIARMDAVKAARRNGNESKQAKTDTERYLVVVFDSREARQAAMRVLGLPDDERYVHWRSVAITRKTGASRHSVVADGGTKVAKVNKSGANG
jgi:ParB-like chromosome segregation protein Spo0J